MVCGWPSSSTVKSSWSSSFTNLPLLSRTVTSKLTTLTLEENSACGAASAGPSEGLAARSARIRRREIMLGIISLGLLTKLGRLRRRLVQRDIGSIFYRGFVDVIDHDDVQRRFRLFQLEAELLFDGRENAWTG